MTMQSDSKGHGLLANPGAANRGADCCGHRSDCPRSALCGNAAHSDPQPT